MRGVEAYREEVADESRKHKRYHWQYYRPFILIRFSYIYLRVIQALKTLIPPFRIAPRSSQNVKERECIPEGRLGWGRRVGIRRCAATRRFER